MHYHFDLLVLRPNSQNHKSFKNPGLAKPQF